jgi:hypothetical protein
MSDEKLNVHQKVLLVLTWYFPLFFLLLLFFRVCISDGKLQSVIQIYLYIFHVL